MRKLLLALAAAALIVVAAVWFLARDERAASPTQRAVSAETSAPAPAVEPAPVASEASPEREAAPDTAVPAATASNEPPVAASDPQGELAELRGRFLLPSGAPAAGVALTLHGWQANQERVMKYGLPEDWPDEIEQLSDGDGRFSFRFDPPRAFQFAVDAKLPGYGVVAWRWSALPRSAVTDVGDVTLAVAGSIRGRVVDKSGKPVGGPWMVYGETPSSRPRSGGGDDARVYAPADPASSEFLLEGLPPGPAELSAYSRIANWIHGQTVDVRAGEETHADIVYDGPDNSRRIVVVVFSDPFYIFNDPASGTIKLRGAGGETRAAVKIPRSSQSWSFEDLEPGTYEIEIDDPKFEPWSRAGVTPGQSIDAHLRGSAAVQLAVSGPDGTAVAAYDLHIRFRFGEGRSVSPNEFALRDADEPLPRAGLYDGLIPTDFTLIVSAAGLGTREVDVDALLPHETRAVSVTLASAATVRGRIVGAPASAIAGARVALAAADIGAEEALEYLRGTWMSDDPVDIRSVEADAQGRFEFAGLLGGRFVVVAPVNAYVSGASEPFEIAAGAQKELDVALAPNAFVVGRLMLPENARTERMLLQTCSATEAANPWWDGWTPFDGAPPPRARLASDASFRLGPLPAGRFHLWLSLHDAPVPADTSEWGSGVGTRFDLGDVELAPPADATVEFDIRERFPGSLVVNVSVNGSPASGYVLLCRRDHEGRTELSRAPVDANGVATVGAAVPGEWELGIGPADRPWWTAWPSVRVQVSAHRESRARVDVALWSGSLRLLDANGRPLAQRSIRVEQSQSGSTTIRADDSGAITLRLPIGHYRVSDAGDGKGMFRPGTAVEIDWTNSGPVPAEVRLEPAPVLNIKLPSDG